MDFSIQEIVDWISALPPLAIYLSFFFIAYLENVLPPIPGDILVVFAGYLIADGVLQFGTTLSLTTLASTLGFMTMYGLGYFSGNNLRERSKDSAYFHMLDVKYLSKAEAWMSRWGQWIIFGNRFLAGTRSVISLCAGMSRTPIMHTIVNSTLSSILWNAILIAGGWLLYTNWQQIGVYLSLYGKIIVSLMVVIGSLFWLMRYLRKKKNK